MKFKDRQVIDRIHVASRRINCSSVTDTVENSTRWSKINGHRGIKDGKTERSINNCIPEAWILSLGLRGIANVGAQLKGMIHGLYVTDRMPRAIS